MKSYTLKAKLEELGVMSSFSRPRVSNNNPYSEALFRTCKYRPGYPQESFKTITDAREWVLDFVDWYNFRFFSYVVSFLCHEQLNNGKHQSYELSGSP